MIAKNRLTYFGLFALLLVFNSCYFPHYRSIAESSLYDINFSEGKWFLNHVTVNGKAWNDLSTTTEATLSSCLNDSLYLSYGKKKAAYNVPILTDKNSREQLTFLKATNSVDYVIQVVGSILANDIGGITIKPMKNAEESSASITIQVYDVNKGSLIYSHTTTGSIEVENNRDDVVFGKSAQTILKKCLKKELKTFKKNGGCE
ncbi:hypothetical protein M0M57_01390 [Flavobacterium azooxidireducens]|uniref:Uncharacterized protein n=1 Tax=Flavobacterium azooxidireducens TaxID=1871076 RepID=A0ABY4KFC3_9FLAO|nr:hypothetical protein [Flavobacterium azooxidireducens]UPQ79505.1 hypothetical protein M0M57_01390 [Flavobacterium azooxidireducens]